jgi:hypothetical protein
VKAFLYLVIGLLIISNFYFNNVFFASSVFLSFAGVLSLASLIRPYLSIFSFLFFLVLFFGVRFFVRST